MKFKEYMIKGVSLVEHYGTSIGLPTDVFPRTPPDCAASYA
jgi:hypothetical protein